MIENIRLGGISGRPLEVFCQMHSIYSGLICKIQALAVGHDGVPGTPRPISISAQAGMKSTCDFNALTKSLGIMLPSYRQLANSMHLLNTTFGLANDLIRIYCGAAL